MIRAEGYRLLVCKSQKAEKVLSLGSGLVNLHVRGAPLGKEFVISKNWIALEEQSLPRWEIPEDRVSTISKIKKYS